MHKKTISVARLLVVLLLGGCLIVPVDLTSDQPQLTPDDEDSQIFNTFLSLLVDKTGLSNLTPNYTVKGITACDGITECTVNPNGDVIWDLRFTLYETNMIQGVAVGTESIDGCLKENSQSSANNGTYNACMEIVRTRMVNVLTDQFDRAFANKINSNCTLIPTNCI